MEVRLVIGALVLCLLSACQWQIEPNSGLLKKSGKGILVATTNYQTGALALLDLDTRSLNLNFAPIHFDAVVKDLPGLDSFLVINRWGADNLQFIRKDTGKTVAQVSLGLGTNPQDAVLEGQFLYVSALNQALIIKFDTVTKQVVKTIDLSSFSDSDGYPEATNLMKKDGLLWVQLQRLNQYQSFSPENASMLVRINLLSDSVVDSRMLKASNPVTAFRSTEDGSILVGEAGYMGNQGKLDGGIEKINSLKFESEGFVTTEALLGGDIVDFECPNTEVCAAIISKPDTELVLFDSRSGLKLQTLWESDGYDLKQLVFDPDSGLLYVTDGDPTEPTIRVWDTQSWFQKWDLNWKMKLPPFQMVLAFF